MTAELTRFIRDMDGYMEPSEGGEWVRADDALERIQSLESELAAAQAEIDRRKVDPRTRLHNLCESLAEEADGSAYSREEWNRIDAENVALRQELADLKRPVVGEEAFEALLDCTAADYASGRQADAEDGANVLLSLHRAALRDAGLFRGLKTLAKEEFLRPSTGNAEFEDLRMQWKLPILISQNAIGATFSFEHAVEIVIDTAREGK